MNTENNKTIDLEVDFKYAESNCKALNNLKASINKGKCIVLCGASGCGKTSLLRVINRLIPEFYEGELKGYCLINGVDHKNQTLAELGKTISSVFQDPRSQFFTTNTTNELAFGLENFGYSHDEIISRVNKIFDDPKYAKYKNRNVFELSSGERQNIAILAAKVLDTDIYLLDEPSANLDYDSTNELVENLKTLKALNKTIILSEHRLYHLKDLADEYWLMDKGEIVKVISKEDMCQLNNAELAKLSLRTNNLDSLSYKLRQDFSYDNHCLELDNLSFAYSKHGKNILKGISSKFYRHEVIGLIGANGSGKTTLGKIIAGLYQGYQGKISFDGKIQSSKDLVNNTIFIMQEAEFQFFTNSVMNELSYGKELNDTLKDRIESLLKRFNLWEVRNQHPFSLSGGQMQKLVLLLAYLSDKKIVVLDEPSAGLDYESLKCCADIIREMQKDKLIIVITHDLELISKVCSRVISLENCLIKDDIRLKDDEDFKRVKTYIMHDMPKPKLEKVNDEVLPLFDPRVKFFVFIVALIAGIGTDMPLIVSSFAMVEVVELFEKRYKSCLMAIILMAAIVLSYSIYPSIVTAFIISFFPRMVLIMYAALMIAREEDSAISLAALRKMHIDEKIIMILAVTIHFFPVLNKDLKIMRQSIKTRGFYTKFSEKLKSILDYFEILIVPMVFRVTRIAESLAASAETRGISLKNHRDSYYVLSLKLKDYLVILMTIVIISLGIIVNI